VDAAGSSETLDLSVELDAGHRVVAMSDAARAMGEFAPDAVPRLEDVVDAAHLPHLLDALRSADERGRSDLLALPFRDGRGRQRVTSAVVERAEGADGARYRVHLGNGASRPLRSTAFAGVTRHSTEAIVVLDRDWRVVDCSPSVRWILGVDPDEFIGRLASADLIGPEYRDGIASAGAQVADGPAGSTAVFRIKVERPGGGAEWYETRLTNLLADPLVLGVVANTRVVTDEQEALDELRHRAQRDVLTGLPDRSAIEGWLRDAMDEVPRSPAGDPADVAVDDDADPTPRRHVLLVDLDGFQQINDTYGHGAGDEVLLRISERLVQACAPRRLGRFGGDEFVVVTEPGEDPAALVARMCAAVSRPLDGVSAAGWQLGLGVGSTAVARVGEPGELLRRADVALVAAKASGRSGHVAYDGALDVVQTERRLLGQQLRRALDEGQFEMRFEPIVDLADGHLVSCEALVRWRHPWRGVLSPRGFMQTVEDEGLQGDLDLWVAEQVVMVAADWDRTGYRSGVGLNVSAQGLAAGFADHLGALCSQHDLAPERLTVELMETIRPRAELTPQIDALRDLGVRLAIDDFGTGYSSLASIQRLDAVALKLDGAFVHGAEHDDGSRSIIRASVSIARTFGMRVIAEWVQSEAQRSALLALGVDEGQGSLFGAAMTAGDFERRHLVAQSTDRARR
jgi:diguanylate cyclase (GGDEF)-like protein/PAS domain S-box-containing protein